MSVTKHWLLGEMIFSGPIIHEQGYRPCDIAVIPFSAYDAFLVLTFTRNAKSKTIGQGLRVRVMVFNATFNNIPVISWQSAVLVEETGIPGENHRPAASHWPTLCCIEYISPSTGFKLTTVVVIGTACTGSCKSKDHTITTTTYPKVLLSWYYITLHNRCQCSISNSGYTNAIVNGVFNLCQHFEISYSRYTNKHYITGVYIAINDTYRKVNLEMQVSKVKFII